MDAGVEKHEIFQKKTDKIKTGWCSIKVGHVDEVNKVDKLRG